MNIVRLLLLLAFLAITGAAEAAIILVNTTANELNTDGDCSLREAIVGANTNTKVDACTTGSGADLIWITAAGTIQTPVGGLPTITDRVEILGHENLTIDGGGTAPIFTVDYPNAAHDFTLTGNAMILRGGRAVGRGGGALYLVNADVVTVKSVIFEGNRACDVLSSGQCLGSVDEIGSGGAIGFSRALEDDVTRLEVADCHFSGNSATGHGGAIAHPRNDNGSFSSTELHLLRSRLIGSSASLGGALFWSGSGDGLIDRSLFAANSASKSGGAAYISGASNYPFFRLTNTMIVDNIGGTGGGPGSGIGGIRFSSVHSFMSFSTVARNWDLSGDGNAAGGTAGPNDNGTSSLSHTAVTDNFPKDCGVVSATFSSYSIDSDGTCGFDDATDLASASAQMSGLGSFMEEPIITLPSLHSPLIDGGSGSCLDAGGNTVSVDYLGNPRPANGDGVGGALCDIGAIEAQPPYDFLFGDGFEAGTTAAWN